MRFTVAWANVISENLALKFVAASLVVVIFSLSIVVVRLAGRKPLIVERACHSRALSIADVDRTPAEIEAFVREALLVRFDTNAQVKPGYLSLEEEKFRTQEQLELKKREIVQRIIVNSVVVNGQTVSVNSDRLFAVGAVRSVLPFPLVLNIGTVTRSETNPYGLTLLQVSAPKSDENSNGGKK
jgi:hypothetical protein